MLRLEFWLPLPLVGLAFWLVSGLITEHNLTQSDRQIEPMVIAPERAKPATNIISIEVRVNRNISQVRVKRATQEYKYHKFELNTTDLSQVETAVSQKLDLSPQQVRQLLRYRVENIPETLY